MWRRAGAPCDVDRVGATFVYANDDHVVPVPLKLEKILDAVQQAPGANEDDLELCHTRISKF